MADLPSRVREYREEIKQCILDDMVLSGLRGIIPKDDEIRLRQMYTTDRAGATGQMLDIVEQSDQPGKWQQFLDALKDVGRTGTKEYPYLAYLLETNNRPSQNYDHEKNIIRIFWPELVRRIDPAEFLNDLYKTQCITMADMQAINSKYNNVGPQAAAVELLVRIQCRQEPGVWYEKLLELMMKDRLDDLVERMEPDFYASMQQRDWRASNSSYPALGQQYGSIQETVISASGEAAAAENNLSPPDRTDIGSLLEQEFTSIDSSKTDNSITQIKKHMDKIELNISGEIEESIERKLLNVEIANDVESEDEFHDAIDEPDVTERQTESIEEIDNRLSESKADNNTNTDNTSRMTLDGSEKVDELYNRRPNELKTDGQGRKINNVQDNTNRMALDASEKVDELYNRQPKELKPDGQGRKINNVQENIRNVQEAEESDDDNLSSDDDDFLENETEGLDLYEQLKLKLRNYQLELAENAVRGDNTIVCAETGSGKTWVALHIVKEHLDKHENGKVVFLARTGTLIKQQSDRFKKYLSKYETILLTGDRENSNLLSQFLEGFNIFCMTPQILLNNLERNPDHLSIHSFTLIIFDECHHAKKEEPYNKVMRKYLSEKLGPSTIKLPQIIGLTASLGVGKSKNDVEATEYILSICANLDAKNLSTVERYHEEFKKHVNLPKEEIVSMRERENDPCRIILNKSIRDIENRIEDMVTLNSSYVTIMNSCPSDKTSQEYAKWTYELMKVAKLTDDSYEETRNISTCAKYLSVLSAALEVNSLLRTEDVQKFLSDRLGNDLKDITKLTDIERDVLNNLREDVKQMRTYARGTENPNVRLLANTLRNMMREKVEESRAMVFVKSRATCKSLSRFLDTDLADIGVRAAALYGKENRDDEEGMTEGRQNETVERFRTGDYKVLVATSVGSEGIDVPDCNIVLSYNYTGNEITKIQMSGRSRKKGGVAMVLGEQDIVRREKINAFKANMMYRAMKTVKLLPQRDFTRKVLRMQREEVDRAKFQKGMEELAQSRRTDETIYELKCARCNTFACYSVDIKVLKKSNHIVVDTDFKDRIKTKPHRSPKKYEGMTKTSKMFCKNCPLDWGIVLDYHGLPCWTLKLACFKFVNTVTNRVTEYKKWLEVPFKPVETEYEDLARLFANTEANTD